MTECLPCKKKKLSSIGLIKEIVKGTTNLILTDDNIEVIAKERLKICYTCPNRNKVSALGKVVYYCNLCSCPLATLTKSLNPIKSNLEEQQVIGSNIEWKKVPDRNSKEIESCIKKLLFSKAWLGKCMGELGSPTPYVNDGKRKEVTDIEPTADVSISNESLDYENATYIEKIDFIRQRIENISNKIKDINTQGQSREFAIARTNAYNYSCEARFELGFELERLKKEHDNDMQDHKVI